MNYKDKIDNLLAEKRKVLVGEKDKILDIFKTNFYSFEKLINDFKKNRGEIGYEDGAYLTISKLLAEDNFLQKGGQPISVAQVAQNMKIVRKLKAGKRRAYKASKVTSSAPASLPEGGKLNEATSNDTNDEFWSKVLDTVDSQKWNVIDRKNLLDLEKMKESGKDLSSIQEACYHKLLGKFEVRNS